MNTKELISLGIPAGDAVEAMKLAVAEFMALPGAKSKKAELYRKVQEIAKNPQEYIDDTMFGRRRENH